MQTTLYCSKDKKDNYIWGLRPPIIYLIKLNQMVEKTQKEEDLNLPDEDEEVEGTGTQT